MADSVREAMGTDIEFENMGGVRAPLINGNITLADIIDMDPFDNKVMTFRVTGRQLKDILLKSRPAVSGSPRERSAWPWSPVGCGLARPWPRCCSTG